MKRIIDIIFLVIKYSFYTFIFGIALILFLNLIVVVYYEIFPYHGFYRGFSHDNRYEYTVLQVGTGFDWPDDDMYLIYGHHHQKELPKNYIHIHPLRKVTEEFYITWEDSTMYAIIHDSNADYFEVVGDTSKIRLRLIPDEQYTNYIVKHRSKLVRFP